VVGTFLVGCACLLAVGCAGAGSDAPQKEQRHTKVAKQKQGQNDLPDCPNVGLLSGTDKPDQLGGKDGEDEIRGLGGADVIFAGAGNDVVYGGPGDDFPLLGEDGADVIYGGDGDEGTIDGGKGADVIYGGDGNDFIESFADDQPDKLYCGKGKDEYLAEDKIDYVDSSCEKKAKFIPIS
jgi:hypothetical protein